MTIMGDLIPPTDPMLERRAGGRNSVAPLWAVKLTELALREISIRDIRDAVAEEHPTGSGGKLPGKQDRRASNLPQTLELRVH